MKLSKRLETIASFVPEGCRAADIGTDHAYIPIYLAKHQKAAFVYALDVKKGPLERAQKNIQRHGLEQKITVRQSDGLSMLQKNEADTVIIAGMGGDLLIHILAGRKDLWEEIKTWVLSPQSELSKVRHYLSEHGFLIVTETMVFEDGKYYNVMKVQRGMMDYQKEIYYLYGKLLIESGDPVFKDFLANEKRKLSEILKQLRRVPEENTQKRMAEIMQQLSLIEETIDEMQ